MRLPTGGEFEDGTMIAQQGYGRKSATAENHPRRRRNGD
jgi:hypothetical protein